MKSLTNAAGACSRRNAATATGLFAGMLAGLAVAPCAALAAAVTIDNPSFESPAIPMASFDTDAPPDDWQAYGASLNFGDRTVGVLHPAGTQLYTEPVPDGDNVGVVFLMNPVGAEAGMQQTLDATLQTMTDYTLTVEVGNIENDESLPPDPWDFTGFPGYRIDLMAGATIIASDNNSLLPPPGGFSLSTINASIGASHPQAGQALTIRLVNLDGPAGTEVNFDDVQLDATAAPECPTTLPIGCKAATTGKSSLKLSRRDGEPDANKLGWNWKGAATTGEDMGNPVATSGYRVCLYDGSGEAVLALQLAAGGTCGTAPCWSPTRKGFDYKNRTGNVDGVNRLKLKAGNDGQAQVKLTGSGSNLAMPSLPLVVTPDPVTMVLTNLETSACWIASYAAPLGDPTLTTRWQARND